MKGPRLSRLLSPTIMAEKFMNLASGTGGGFHSEYLQQIADIATIKGFENTIQEAVQLFVRVNTKPMASAGRNRTTRINSVG